MAGLRGIVAGLVIGSAIISLPAGAQHGSSASLTHTVTVTVPPRVKVKVANLAFSTSPAVSVASAQTNAAGLALTIDANRAWVLSIGSASGVSARKSHLQWSTGGNSGFTPVTARDVAVASGATSYDAKAASLFFRDATSTLAGGQDEMVVLTVSAP